jgi:DNA transposition AAA+ family ATPase
VLRDEQTVTPELAAQVVTRFHEFIRRSGKSAGWAARSMGIGESTLSQVLAGNYAAESEKHLRALDKWLERQFLKEAAPKPAGFVRTRVAELIYAHVNVVTKLGCIGLIHGPAGIGKTICLQAIRAETPGSIYLAIPAAGQSKLALLEQLVVALRGGGWRMSAHQAFQHVVGILKDTGRMILVDEIHRAEGSRNDHLLHILRDIHDHTGCPMVWAGVSNIDAYLRRGKAKGFEPLDQVNSRIKVRLNLTAIAEQQSGGGPGLVTIEDIRKVFAAGKMRLTSDAERYLQMLANTPSFGAFRACDGLVRLAAICMGGAGTINAACLRSILRDQLGLSGPEGEEEAQGSMAAAG